MAEYLTLTDLRSMLAKEPVKVDRKLASQMALEGMSPGERVLANIGSGVDDLIDPFKSRAEVDEKRERDAELNDTFAGKALSFAGNVLPTIALPFGAASKPAGAALKAMGAGSLGAKIAGNTAADLILTGAALGAAAPVGTDDSRLTNTALGAVGGAVFPVLGAAWRGAKNIVAPFTQKGAQGIAGKALNEAGMPASLNVTQHVPGSIPTTVEATQSPTLAQIQKALANRNPNFRADLATVAAEQNAARWSALNDIAGNADTIAAAAAARDAKALPIKDSAFSKAKKPDTQALADVADMLGSGSTRLRTNAANALDTVKGKLAQSKNASDLYAVRQEIDDMLAGRVGDVNKGAKFAGEELMQMKGAIDDALNAATGGKWQKYLETYIEGSKPVNRMESLQDLLSKFRTGAPDTMTLPTINQSGWRHAMEQSVPVFGGGTATRRTALNDVLNIGQQGVLDDVERDLMRSYQADRLVAARGSDTMQNLEGGNLLLRSLNGVPKPSGTSGFFADAIERLANARQRRPMAELEAGLLSPSYAQQLAASARPAQKVKRGLLDIEVDPLLMLEEIARLSAARGVPLGLTRQ